MKTNNSGFTLLEILMALSVIAVGFLVMAQMQFLSLKLNQWRRMDSLNKNKLDTNDDINTGSEIAIAFENFVPGGRFNEY